MQTYIAEIINRNGSHRVRLSKPNNLYSPVEFPAAFNQDATLTVNSQPITLGELARKLVEYQESDLKTFFSERGQLDIGSYLFEQLFSGLDKNELARLFNKVPETIVDLRIVTEDETAARLPWSLLYADRRFLAVSGWSVRLSTPPEDCKNVELLPSPKIMVVMPQPKGWSQTSARAHLEELERTLSNVNPLHVCGKNLCLVKTWEDFKEQLPRVNPDVIYFYGHGDSDTTESKLIFAMRERNEPIEVSASVFTNVLRDLPMSPPRLAYINCCLGDAGGLLGVGRQLSGVVPAVITNCTMAEVEAAQTQALDIWRSILLDGLAPHSAVATMRKNLGGQQAGGLSDARWLAPIVHCHYDKWEFKPPRDYESEKIDPNWEYTLDRIIQTGVAMLLTSNMLRISKPRALSFIWYGKQNQGVEEFYKRLEVELQNQFKETSLYSPNTLELPADLHEFDRSISDMLREAFQEDDFNKIADKIRVESNNLGRRRTIVYLRHPVIVENMEFYKTAYVKNYLEWLDVNFINRLSPNVFVLVGLSFIVREPERFSEVVRRRFDGVRYNNLMLRVLNELGQIVRSDLDDFFDMHNIYLPRDNRENILDHIMKKTDGQYRNALEELKSLRQKGVWNYGRENLEMNFVEVEDGEY